MNRGEIRWYTFRPPDKRRPVLILTRNEVIERLNEIIVVPVTRTIRGLSTEVLLSQGDGMPVLCTLNFDHISLAQHERIGAVLCMLPESRWPEVRRALLVACPLWRRRLTARASGQQAGLGKAAACRRFPPASLLAALPLAMISITCLVPASKLALPKRQQAAALKSFAERPRSKASLLVLTVALYFPRSRLRTCKLWDRVMP